ncbi:MAG: hypothetical protein D6728_06100 [Cyanobacteria bacterium J055]|nr:MAG: hypothetical protein D6728_06100 [Cyanobacteria bacterium J055]
MRAASRCGSYGSTEDLPQFFRWIDLRRGLSSAVVFQVFRPGLETLEILAFSARLAPKVFSHRTG